MKLGELVNIQKGTQINGCDLMAQGAYYVMNGGITPSGYHSEYNAEANTISISEGGNSCGYVQFNINRFWSGGHCYTLTLKESNPPSNTFLYHYLKWKEADIMALRIGSGLPNIQKKDLCKFPVLLPSIDIQKIYVSIFDTIESKINIESELLSLCSEQKDYLLAQMFI